MSRVRQALRDERGSFLVPAAIALIAFALLGGALLEFGHWYQERRDLQVRTDAAAFSAGQALNACFNIGSTAFPTETDADTYIQNWAKNYGGFTTLVSTQTGSPYNPQFGSGSSLMSFQSDTFPSSANPQPTENLGPECFADGNPSNTDPSNVNLMTDVRMTQAGISPFFSFSPFATVHGWARVQLQSIKSLRPTLPLAIPDVNPKHVAVTFVDNSTGQALAGCANGCMFPLNGPTNTPPATINDWGGQATIPMPAADTNVGIRVSIGSQNGSCAGVNATATYTCYDYSNTGQPNPNGIIAIRSYSTAAVSGATPILRSVEPTTCILGGGAGGTPYFSAYQATSGTCNNVGVTAVVDFPTGATNKKVTDSITQGSCNNPDSRMTQSGNTWASSLISLPNGQGAYNVCLAWSYDDSSNTHHKGTFGAGSNGSPVQQIFSGSDGSDPTQPGGPIMAASVFDTGGNPGYSFAAGSSVTVAVGIGLTGGVHLNPRCSNANGNSGANYVCASDPTVLLRTQTKTGSLTYAIDCGTIPGHNGGTLFQQLAYGCANSFSPNSADVCPDPANPTPPDCAPVQTGIAVGQVQQALNTRFVPNGVCAANNYPLTTVDGDPRVVLLVDTDFSAFIGSGGSSSSDVPVVTFATFYVTGWNGAPNSCNNQPAPPNAGSNGNSANIWGHFIAYATGGGTPSGIKCDLTGVAPCVAALVR